MALLASLSFAAEHTLAHKKGCTANNGHSCRVLVTQNAYLPDLSKYEGPLDVSTCGKKNTDPNSLDFANCLCQTEGNVVNNGQGTWRAWLSTEKINAVDNIAPQGAANHDYVRHRSPSVVIAHSLDQLLSWELADSILPKKEYASVWTGTNMGGSSTGWLTCKGWTTLDDEHFGVVGVAFSTKGGGWTYIDDHECSKYARRKLYCFEVPQTVWEVSQ